MVYEVAWDSFSSTDEYNFLDNCACHRVNMALRCLDAKTKAHLQQPGVLVRVALRNVTDAAARLLALSNGTLQLTCVFGKGLGGCYSDSAILAELKKSVPKK